MKPKQFIPAWKFSTALCFMILAVFCSISIFSEQSYGKTAKEIDASVDAVMDRFYKQVKDAKEVVQQLDPLVEEAAALFGLKREQGIAPGDPLPDGRFYDLAQANYACLKRNNSYEEVGDQLQRVLKRVLAAT